METLISWRGIILSGDWTLILFTLVCSFICTSLGLDPANPTGKQSLPILISSALQGLHSGFSQESLLPGMHFQIECRNRSMIYPCRFWRTLFCLSEDCIVIYSVNTRPWGHRGFGCGTSGSRQGSSVLFQEKSRGWGQEGEFPLQQSHVLPPPHWPRGATQNQLPDPGYTTDTHTHTIMQLEYAISLVLFVYCVVCLDCCCFLFSVPCISVPWLSTFVKSVGHRCSSLSCHYLPSHHIYSFLLSFSLSFISFSC